MFSMKCGNCGKMYTIEEFVKLNKIKMVEEDTNPEEEHGYTPVCECGYRFAIDSWRQRDTVKISTEKGDIDIDISSVFLELNHSHTKEEDKWYETMIFPQIEWLECGYQDRYKTMEEAIEGHNRVINLLKDGKYRIENADENCMELTLDGSEDKYDVIYKVVKMLRSEFNDKQET